jgi:hypothetical protein
MVEGMCSLDATHDPDLVGISHCLRERRREGGDSALGWGEGANKAKPQRWVWTIVRQRGCLNALWHKDRLGLGAEVFG